MQRHYRRRSQHKPVDYAMDIVAVVSPLMGVPQVVQVFAGHTAAGLSLFSWLAFAVTTSVFLLYAIAHRIKPLVVANALWLCVYVAVIPGIIMYG